MDTSSPSPATVGPSSASIRSASSIILKGNPALIAASLSASPVNRGAASPSAKTSARSMPSV